jgi:hypothetical protein
MRTAHEYILDEKVDIDMDVFDRLYPYALSKQWVHLTQEMVIEWMGYKKLTSSMRNAHERIQKNFRAGIDYVEVDSSHKLISPSVRDETRGGHNRKYFLITGDTLMMMLITARNRKAMRTAAHFVFVYFVNGVYKLMMNYYQYQCEELKQDFEAQLAELRAAKHIREHKKEKDLEELEAKLAHRHRVGLVYFIFEAPDAADAADAKEETNAEETIPFKIGCTFNLKNRLADLNCATSPACFACKAAPPRVQDSLLYPHHGHGEHHPFPLCSLHEKHAGRIRNEWFRFVCEANGLPPDRCCARGIEVACSASVCKYLHMPMWRCDRRRH